MSGPHILVVDDEADIRGLLKEILSEEGYEVDVAANAAQARASRARQTPDLVLLDIWMPDIDGISLLREWSSSATDGCPVVMMSGHGTVEEAGEGTLFIHEVEDLPASVQRLLVGVLESGRFTRLGGVEPVGLRSRVLSAAQPGIENRAGTESFRRDLLAHLNMLIVRVPPLRDYAEDVPELLRHYVDRLVDTEGLPFRRFSVAAQNRLRNYPWPDNVRELKNLVHRLLIQGGPEEIRLEEIERELAVQAPPGEPLVKQDLLALPLREAREQFERAYLQQQLLLCNGKVGQLAKRVGMERTHLYRKLRSLGGDFRNISED